MWRLRWKGLDLSPLKAAGMGDEREGSDCLEVAEGLRGRASIQEGGGGITSEGKDPELQQEPGSVAAAAALIAGGTIGGGKLPSIMHGPLGFCVSLRLQHTSLGSSLAHGMS